MPPRFAVHTRRGFLLEAGVCRSEAIQVVHVVQKRREPQLLVPSCRLPYPLQRTGRAVPARCPGRVLLAQVSFGQTASLHPLRGRSPGVVRRLHRYYRSVRLPLVIHRRRASVDFPRDPPLPVRRATTGSPGSRARCFRTCTGSLTARSSVAARDSVAPDGAFRISPLRRHSGVILFRGSIPGPHVPLSTLRRRPCRPLRMTRGRCGSLVLHRMTLAFTTPRRFIPRTERRGEYPSRRRARALAGPRCARLQRREVGKSQALIERVGACDFPDLSSLQVGGAGRRPAKPEAPEGELPFSPSPVAFKTSGCRPT